jgi:hypothetical protein
MNPGEVLALVLLHNVGKAGTHALRYAAWARQPLIEGLPISDLYHGLSGSMWLLVAYVCVVGFGSDWLYWTAAVVGCGIIWPVSKLFKPVGGRTLTIREALLETWYMQLARKYLQRG